MLDSSEGIDVVGLLFAMVAEREKRGGLEVVTEENTLPEQSPEEGCEGERKAALSE